MAESLLAKFNEHYENSPLLPFMNAIQQRQPVNVEGAVVAILQEINWQADLMRQVALGVPDPLDI
jgi:hypothetical protein